jgi:hypothetical protein
MNDDVKRGTSRFSRTGTATHHILVPKPLLKFLKWEVGEELMVYIHPDNTVRVTTLEQAFKERIDQDRAERRRAGAELHA